MSLESSIELLAQAINELAAAHRNQEVYKGPAPELKNSRKVIEGSTKELLETKAGGELKKPQEASMTPELSKASAQTTESSSPAPTYDDVKKLILAISAKSRDKVVALLARYGAKKGPDLQEAQYALFVHEGNLVLSGDLDPEAGA